MRDKEQCFITTFVIRRSYFVLFAIRTSYLVPLTSYLKMVLPVVSTELLFLNRFVHH
jgi:hypothetical protein